MATRASGRSAFQSRLTMPQGSSQRSFANQVVLRMASEVIQPYKTHPPIRNTEPTVHTFFDKDTATWTYVVVATDGKTCLLIDPVLDYEATTSRISTESADKLLAFVQQKGYRVDRILETHAHADHLTAAQYLKRRIGELQLGAHGQDRVPICIGEGIGEVQQRFAPRYGISAANLADDFDVLFKRSTAEGDTFDFGGTTCQVLHLPGHTPDHVGYKVGDNIFSGDVVFQPDVGSARADFPGGSASLLFASLQQILSLPESTRLYIGHDYPPSEGEAARPPSCYSTVELTKKQNIHLQPSEDLRSNFVEFRTQRDAKLAPPKLLHPSLQVNIRAGKLPPAKEDGTILFQIPVSVPKHL